MYKTLEKPVQDPDNRSCFLLAFEQYESERSFHQKSEIIGLYNQDWELIWEDKLLYSSLDWYSQGFYSDGDYIWEEFFYRNDTDKEYRIENYICQFTMNGDLLGVYGIPGSAVFLGFVDGRAVLYQIPDVE